MEVVADVHKVDDANANVYFVLDQDGLVDTGMPSMHRGLLLQK